MLYEFEFPSSNERDQIQAWFVVPAAKYRGIIQLIHGFGEHSRRYIHMISHFLDAGFIVAMDDHVGHGKTAVVNDSWGDWGNGGYETMVDDEITLMNKAKKTFPDLPYFVFGHSMGSVIARQMIARVGDQIKGVTLCGTCGSFETKESREILEKAVEEGRGDEAGQDATAALLGSFAQRLKDVKYGNEWICHDPYVQKDHAEDPLDAFMKPTDNKSMLKFVQMIEEITSDDWFKKVPTSLPVYMIAGDQDPFGHYGQGVYEASNKLIDSGHQVTTRLYSGRRHEIHNYVEIRDEVEDGIISFYNRQLDEAEE